MFAINLGHINESLEHLQRCSSTKFERSDRKSECISSLSRWAHSPPVIPSVLRKPSSYSDITSQFSQLTGHTTLINAPTGSGKSSKVSFIFLFYCHCSLYNQVFLVAIFVRFRQGPEQQSSESVGGRADACKYADVCHIRVQTTWRIRRQYRWLRLQRQEATPRIDVGTLRNFRDCRDHIVDESFGYRCNLLGMNYWCFSFVSLKTDLIVGRIPYQKRGHKYDSLSREVHRPY